MYRVKATRNGGLLGFAQSWAKVEGKVFETENFEDAESLASEWTKEMNTPNSSARFTYTVIDMEQ